MIINKKIEIIKNKIRAMEPLLDDLVLCLTWDAYYSYLSFIIYMSDAPDRDIDEISRIRIELEDFQLINNKSLELTDLEYTKITSLRFKIQAMLDLLVEIHRRKLLYGEMDYDTTKLLGSLFYGYGDVQICVDELLESHKNKKR